MKRLERIAFALAIVLMMTLLASIRSASASSCSQTISSCGCTIDTGGIFTTNGALTSASSSVDCIDITASGAVLILGGNITGPGAPVTADGIRVMSSATNSFIEGDNIPVGGKGFSVATISGFANGIEDDATGVIIDAVKANGNTVNGVFLNNASHSLVGNSVADGNTATGILVQGGNNNALPDDSVDSNGIGVEITGGSQNLLLDSGTAMNAGYGTWIRGSDQNAIKDSGGGKNATGIYIGCAAKNGPTGKACTPAVAPANSNKIQASGASNNTSYGIAVDKGNTFNFIVNSGGGSNGTLDLFDKNPGCDHNVWLSDVSRGTKATPKCIH